MFERWLTGQSYMVACREIHLIKIRAKLIILCKRNLPVFDLHRTTMSPDGLRQLESFGIRWKTDPQERY